MDKICISCFTKTNEVMYCPECVDAKEPPQTILEYLYEVGGEENE